jgi:hypothetical protein
MLKFEHLSTEHVLTDMGNTLRTVTPPLPITDNPHQLILQQSVLTEIERCQKFIVVWSDPLRGSHEVFMQMNIPTKRVIDKLRFDDQVHSSRFPKELAVLWILNGITCARTPPKKETLVDIAR